MAQNEDDMSIDDVYQGLNVIPEGMTERGLIATTIHYLPPKVRDSLIFGGPTFLIMQGYQGYYVEVPCSPHHEEKIWELIALNFTTMKDLSTEEQMDVVAHEIAHYVLGHHVPTVKNPVSQEEEKRREIEADDLCEKWGFRRGYDKSDWPYTEPPWKAEKAKG